MTVFATKWWSNGISNTEQQLAEIALNVVKTLIMSACSILTMSDKVLHCSGPNASTK
jgi:hypothetical protein|tara:strand:- start:271 stop:441 length:171 start_codon:yes stop_codon:yes gene_type:complete